MTNEYDYRGYEITERQLENGWYELSAMVVSMGEEYRESKRYDHKPTGVDYDNFTNYIETTK